MPKSRGDSKSRIGKFFGGNRKETYSNKWAHYILLSQEEEEDLRILKKIKDPSRTESNRLQRLERRRKECLVVPSEARWAIRHKVDPKAPEMDIIIARRQYWVERVFMGEQGHSRREAVLLAHERLEGITKDIEEAREEDINSNNLFYEGSD